MGDGRIYNVIVVVEGVSAVGKTTWCATHGSGNVVAETGRFEPPAGLGDHEHAQFWHGVNCGRWAEAMTVEAECGLAICDTDPLKLHYDYCLAILGLVTWQRFDVGADLALASIVARQLGIADVVLVRAVDDERLLCQQDLDTTRRRSNFNLHRQLGPALNDWYRTLSELAPGRVIWEFPSEVPAAIERDRYDVDLFQLWMANLPRRPRRPWRAATAAGPRWLHLLGCSAALSGGQSGPRVGGAPRG